ncbi:MAG: redoxin domain-containing protein [Anaerolineales bacterium]|nr:redoxin domain-containing protein [Anaerolineales bacterium]
MRLSQRSMYALILLLGLVWIYLSADENAASFAGTPAAPQRNFLAPDFSLPTTDGETMRLSDFRGQAVLVNLWATWCPPCRAEMPAIEKVYNEYKDEGFVVLAIDMTYQDKLSSVPPFVQEHELTFPILLDETGETARAYQLRSLPSSFFIDRNGIIREVVIGGPMAEALLRTRVEEILK